MKDCKNNENNKLCKECGGQCCMNCGCAFSPRDFTGKITKEKIKRLIRTGLISLDWWDGDPSNETDSALNDTVERAYFIRIRNFVLDHEDKLAPIIDPTFGGRCILLTNDGCRLSFNYRPYQGQSLIPSSEECIDGYSKKECCIEWLKYNNILSDIHKIFIHYDFIGQSLYGKEIKPTENSIDNLIKILNEE